MRIRILKSIICLMIAVPFMAFADEPQAPALSESTVKFRVKGITRQAAKDVVCKDITLSAPGTLESVLGDDINNIDSLVVRGPINAADFHTIWSASFNGNLSVINLEGTSIENGIIPPRAFWHQDEQLQEDGTIYVIALKRIILPNQIKTIGDFAFSYAIHLESINIPSKLQNLGIYCFSDCMSLATNPMQLPEGLMDIPAMCFMNCESLDEIKLPTTIKHIGEGGILSV